MIKPSRFFYVLGVLVLFLGAGAFGALLWQRISAMSEGFVRVVVPGERRVELKEAGEYTLYHEHKSVVNGRVFSTAQGQGIQGMTVEVFSEDGSPIELKPVTMSSTYSFGSHEGSALFSFVIPRPGSYRIAARLAGGAFGPEVVLAVSRETMGDLIMTVFLAIGTLFGSIVLSTVILLWTFFKRQKAIKAAAAR